MIDASVIFTFVSATVIGNLITIFAILVFFGVVSLRYVHAHEVGGFATFVGVLLALVVGVLLATETISLIGWVTYVVLCVIVSIIQATVFDMREFVKRETTRDGVRHFPTYRWIDVETVYDGVKPVGQKAKVNRSELSSFVVAYIFTAPFLVIHWAFHEVISGIADWVSSNLMGRLQKRLDRIM